jgi:hypothetical protein
MSLRSWERSFIGDFGSDLPCDRPAMGRDGSSFSLHWQRSVIPSWCSAQIRRGLRHLIGSLRAIPKARADHTPHPTPPHPRASESDSDSVASGLVSWLSCRLGLGPSCVGLFGHKARGAGYPGADISHLGPLWPRDWHARITRRLEGRARRMKHAPMLARVGQCQCGCAPCACVRLRVA